MELFSRIAQDPLLADWAERLWRASWQGALCALAGSLSPFTAYLAQAETVSDEELQQLQDVVRRLQQRRKG